MAEDDATSVSELLRWLREDVQGLRSDVQQATQQMTPRSAWEQRNREVDRRFEDQGKDISDVAADVAGLRAEMNAKRAPWWTIVSAIVGVGGFAWLIFGPAVLAAGG